MRLRATTFAAAFVWRPVLLRVTADGGDFVVLQPMDTSADEMGYFPCGKEAQTIEVKAVKLPEGLKCEHCVLQLSWKSEEEYYVCSDVITSRKELWSCLGKEEECADSKICSAIAAVGDTKSNSSKTSKRRDRSGDLCVGNTGSCWIGGRWVFCL